MFGFIKRNTTEFTNIFTLLLLFKQIVLPHLDYCSSIWFPSTSDSINSLERVQRKFIKFLRFKFNLPYSHDEYLTYVEELSLQPLYSRRAIHNLKLVHKIANNTYINSNFSQIIQPHVPSYNCRTSMPYDLPLFKTDIWKQHPIYAILKICNTKKILLDENIKSIIPLIKEATFNELIKILK